MFKRKSGTSFDLRMGGIRHGQSPLESALRSLGAAVDLWPRTATANRTIAAAGGRPLTGNATWMRRCSTTVAAAVLLAWLGPPPSAASERIPPPRLSDFPLSFLGTEHLLRRTGLYIDPGFGTHETDAPAPDIEMRRGMPREPARWYHGMILGGKMAAGLSTTRIETEDSSGVRRMRLWTFGHAGGFHTAPDKGDVNLFGLFVERALAPGMTRMDRAGAIAGGIRGEQFYGGVGWTGQSAGNDYSINASFSRHFDPTRMEYDDGSLLALGYSTEIGYRRDILYASGYWAEGDFRRLANSGPPPLRPIGLSLSGGGLGDIRPAPWPRLLDSAGFAIGMRTFFAEQAANWTVELGHRQDLEKEDWLGSTSGTALSTRAQFRLAERLLLQMDAFYAIHGRDSIGPRYSGYDDDSAALRVELRVNF